MAAKSRPPSGSGFAEKRTVESHRQVRVECTFGLGRPGEKAFVGGGNGKRQEELIYTPTKRKEKGKGSIHLKLVRQQRNSPMHDPPFQK